MSQQIPSSDMMFGCPWIVGCTKTRISEMSSFNRALIRAGLLSIGSASLTAFKAKLILRGTRDSRTLAVPLVSIAADPRGHVIEKSISASREMLSRLEAELHLVNRRESRRYSRV